MNYAVHTDIGKRYPHNEDCYFIPQMEKEADLLRYKKMGYIYILCDGMGGGNAGEVASQMVASWLSQDFYSGEEDDLQVLIKAVNDRVFKLSQKHKEYEGMGTTVVGVVVHEKKMSFFSVGDSRAYVFRDTQLIQITEDQSEVWKLYALGQISKDAIRLHPRSNVITHALGVDGNFKKKDVQIYQEHIKAGDLVMLCSDGLTDMVSEHDISAILSNTQTTLQSKADTLVDAANEAGGKDNITVILIQL